MRNRWYVDTYMYGSAGGFCPDDWSNDVCVTYRGGLYDSSKSQGAKVGMTLARVDDDTPSNWTLDDVKLQNTTLGIIDLPQYEFGVRTSSVNRFVHKGEIGLARNSTFLRGLANANRTSSNTWSLFWGTEVTSPQRDGSITFGGYDEAIVGDSPNITVPFDRSDDRCREGMIVEITGMTLQTTASSQDVMQGLGRQKVCIVPSAANLLTLPTRYWDRMQSIMGVELHSFRNGTAETYFYNTTIVRGASATYTGNLSITLNDALTVTVPNNQLLFGETFIAAGRGLIETKKDIISIPIVRSNDMMPRIGAMFFSVAYLMVDNDKERFTISRANPTPATQKLLGIDTANDCVSAANVVGADPTNPSDIPPSSESSGAPSNGSSGHPADL
ncbi:aspartic peptidase domain-containing protein [Pyrenochaeta sp. MPI-SDFR-AT-0127]|nr:aspartic peptidase domain-containing protein [Pyrenochaeta sp. MPI-SDFR-AT-0127]